jgi:hypothetical protein
MLHLNLDIHPIFLLCSNPAPLLGGLMSEPAPISALQLRPLRGILKNICASLTFGVCAGRLCFPRGFDASTPCNCPRTGQPRWSRQGPGWMRRRWSRLWRPHQSSRFPPRAGAWLRCSHAAQQQSQPAEGRCSCQCLHHSHCNALGAFTNIVMSADP